MRKVDRDSVKRELYEYLYWLSFNERIGILGELTSTKYYLIPQYFVDRITSDRDVGLAELDAYLRYCMNSVDYRSVVNIVLVLVMCLTNGLITVDDILSYRNSVQQRRPSDLRKKVWWDENRQARERTQNVTRFTTIITLLFDEEDVCDDVLRDTRLPLQAVALAAEISVDKVESVVDSCYRCGVSCEDLYSDFVLTYIYYDPPSSPHIVTRIEKAILSMCNKRIWEFDRSKMNHNAVSRIEQIMREDV